MVFIATGQGNMFDLGDNSSYTTSTYAELTVFKKQEPQRANRSPEYIAITTIDAFPPSPHLRDNMPHIHNYSHPPLQGPKGVIDFSPCTNYILHTIVYKKVYIHVWFLNSKAFEAANF